MEYGQTISRFLLSLLVLFVYVIIGNGRDVFVCLLSFPLSLLIFFLFAFFRQTLFEKMNLLIVSGSRAEEWNLI